MNEETFEGILIRRTDNAQVWFDAQFNNIFIRHVLREGEYTTFVCNEYGEEFAPHMKYNNFYFIGIL